MKILYIHQYFVTPDVGGGIRSYEFARRFVQAGHQVTMLAGKGTVKGGDITEVDGIKVIRFPVRYSNHMKSTGRIKSFLAFAWQAYIFGRKLEKPDVIYATSTPLTVGFPALMLSRRFRCPYVFEVRDLWPEAPVQMQAVKNPFIIWLLRRFEKLIYKKAAHIIGLSPGMVDGILAAGAPATKISMIPNCSDLEYFGVQADSDIVHKYGLDGKTVILYAGALSDANGLDIIIEGAMETRHRDDIVYVIAGGGRRKNYLSAKAAELKLSNVLFVGKLLKYEVAKLHAIAAACLVLFKELPILSTNSPNKFFDALAAGRAVITNMNGWVHDLVTEHRAGIGIGAVPSGRSKRLAEAIEHIADHPEEARTMGINARRLAETQFDRNLLAFKVLDILELYKNK